MGMFNMFNRLGSRETEEEYQSILERANKSNKKSGKVFFEG